MLVKFPQHLFRRCQFYKHSIFFKPEVAGLCRLFRDETNASVHEPSNKVNFNRVENNAVEPEIQTKLLKVVILGNPNVGKSALINQIMNRRVFASSSKIHTTRCKARAVLNEGDTQLIFLDTPGLVTATESKRYQLETSFLRDTEKCVQEADIIGVLHDVSARHYRDNLDIKVLRLLHLYPKKHSILIMNKIDLLKSKRTLLHLVNVLTNKTLKIRNIDESQEEEEFLPLSEKSVLKKVKDERGWRHFSEVFMISALDGSGVGDLREYLLNQAKPRKWIFSEDVFTDKNPEHIIEESVRSRLLDHLPHEIPYGLETQLEYLETTPEGTIVAVVLVKCARTRIEKLVMGAGGGRIKIIARQAEQELANTFYTVVKVKIVVISRESEESKKSDTINC